MYEIQNFFARRGCLQERNNSKMFDLCIGLPCQYGTQGNVKIPA